MMHQLLPPTPDCRRLNHPTGNRPRTTGTGKLEYCTLCTLGYEMAITAFDGDEQRADNFVRSLRRERAPLA